MLAVNSHLSLKLLNFKARDNIVFAINQEKRRVSFVIYRRKVKFRTLCRDLHIENENDHAGIRFKLKVQ